VEKFDNKNVQDILALTPMQEGMLFHYLKEPGSSAYCEQLSLRIKGDIRLDAFEQAWNFVIRSNEMLRTVFRWEKMANPIQIILKEHQLYPKYYDFSVKAAGERENHLEEIKVKDRQEKFDLREVPFRVTLCKIQKANYEMIIGNHHILFDGWSNGIILKEFFNAYNDLVNGKPLVKPGKGAFKEFVHWTKTRDRRKSEKSWKAYLKGLDSGTQLSIKKKNRKEITGTGRYRSTMERHIKGRLEGFVKRYRRTLASIFYSAWGLLLQRYNSSDDVIFGTTISGRNAGVSGIEDMVGLFINTLPLRIQTDDNESIGDLLERIHRDLHTREEYEGSSLVEIKQSSDMDPGGELFDTIVVLENYPLASMLERGLISGQQQSLSVESYAMKEQTHYDLTLGITIFKEIEVSFVYNEGVLDKESIINMSGHFMNIIRGIIADPFGKISDIDIITGEERNKIIYDFNNTGADFPKTKMLHQIFEEQVERIPDNTAVVGPLQMKYRAYMTYMTYISYLELNRQAESLAHMLKEKCLQPDTIVGIMADSSMETIIGILAIFKAGGVYLPLDPDYPQDRINYMLKDSGAKILLTGQEIAGLIHPSTLLPFYPSSSSSLAYIIYTSGSTGRPRGVLVQHRSVINILAALQRYYPLMETDAYLLKTSYLFDVSVTELFGWFWAGGKLVLMEKANRKDPGKILEAIKWHHITHINFVPSMFSAFVEILEQEKGQTSRQLKSLKYIFLAGEALLPELVNRFQRLETGILLENLYGPTEGTIYASGYSLSQWTDVASVPIGKPLANVRLYILNQYHRVQPVGVAGELCIAGEGLARGYLNRPALTAERFCLRRPGGRFLKKLPPWTPRKNFSLGVSHMSYRSYKSYILYRTGDLARWLADGNIEFLGRRDHQVKIRGFRVELGEIENLLLKHEDIKDAAVNVWRGEAGDDIYLCAYIVLEKQIKISRVREYLSKELPGYMVPAYFIRMVSLPLTSSGKIDRKALPAPGINVGNDYVAPGDEIEIKLVKIWMEVLGTGSKIGIDDNFFDLGGHSLKAARVASRIHKELNIIVTLQEIMKYSSIRKLARCIYKAKKSEYVSPGWAEQKEYYLLSPAQERLYILQQMEKDNITYNMPRLLIFETQPDTYRLETAMQRLIEMHECLRTSFQIVTGEPVQFIHDQVKFEIEYYDISEVEVKVEVKVEEGRSSRLEGTRGLAPLSLEPVTALINSFIRPFDLSRLLLVRVGLIRLDYHRHILMVDMHHIISDGVSIGVLLKDFTAIYAGKELSPVKMYFTYKDFSEWQNSGRQKQEIKKQEQYWLKRFEGDIPVLNLPADYPRPKVWSFAGGTIHFELGKEETWALSALARNRDASLFAVLAAMFGILLGKLSGQEDIVIGTVSAGRRHAVLENIIGMFVNTLVLGSFPGGDKTISQFLNELEKTAFEAFENQDYPFEELVARLVKDRDAGRNPLFDVMFVLQDLDIPVIEAAGLKLTPLDYDMGISKFDLTFLVEKSGDGLLFTVEYSTKLFKESTMQRFIGYFRKVLTDVLKDVGQKISGIEIIGEEEKKVLLYDFNDTKMDYPGDKTIHRLFEGQVERTPDRLALVGQIPNQEESCGQVLNAFGEVHLTYRELSEKANQLAYLLMEKRVVTDAIVGIIGECSLEMTAGILGILKAGGAYLPIDPDYPEERIAYMLADSRIRFLITTPGSSGKFAKLSIVDCRLSIINCQRQIACSAQSKSPLDRGASSTFLRKFGGGGVCLNSQLAYIIYTSGTTGKPKGVMIEHRSLVNLCSWHNRYYQVKASDRAAQYARIGFDASVWEIFPYLVKGASVTIINPGIKTDIEMLNRYYETHDITIGFLPTQLCERFMQLENHSLRKLLTGGDRLRTFIKRDYELYNNYGPTENTVVNTSFPVNRDHTNIPIGRPVDNNRIYILDKNHLLLQPIGIPGELCIGGDGLARGYLNNPELTEKKFVRAVISHSSLVIKNFKRAVNGHLSFVISSPSKLSPNDQCPMTNDRSYKLYRTGDLVRWLPDANIEFLGRIDRQVKIRGFRIELGEIESRLLKYTAIKDAVVIARTGNDGDKYLCAYFVAGTIDITRLREFLSASLPDYMIPSYFLQMQHLPLTSSGKVNRKTLPEPVIKTGKNVVSPRDEIEKKLLDIWSEVLGRDALPASQMHASQLHEAIGIDHHFFELGGHSLKAAIVISMIHKVFNVRLTLAQLFTRPTIRALAQSIREAVTGTRSAIEPAEKKEYYPLSPAQKRLYIFQEGDKDKMIYNIPLVMVLQGELEKEHLEEAFRRLIERHDSFRTSFAMVQGEPVQRSHHEVKFKIEYFDLATEDTENTEGTRGLAPLFREPVTALISSFIRPFDLSRAPLLRLGLVKTGHEQHLLMMDMHHIIFDGTSMKILINEWLALAEGKELPPLQVQYKDFSLWQNSQPQREKVKNQEIYWLKRFQGEIPSLKLPYDYPRPAARSYEGNTLEFRIDMEITRALQQLAAREEVTLFMVLLAVYNILLSKLSWSEDIVVGTTTAGRHQVELQPVIGMFVNTLALRNYPGSEKTFKEFLQELKIQTLAAFENQDYPFENLVEKVAAERDASHSPLFDTLFTLQNIGIPEAEMPGLSLKSYDYQHPVSRVDMTWLGEEKQGTIRFTIEYSTKLFREATIKQFGEYFKMIINAVLEDRETRLKDIEVSTGLTALEETTYQEEAAGDFGF
jgi:amino acid adenylation domain-containing protein